MLMSRLLMITATAALLATTAQAAPFVGSSGWTTSEDFGGTSERTERVTLIEGFLALIGFDQNFSATATLGTAPTLRDVETKSIDDASCDDVESASESDHPSQGADDEQAGPEPILFAF